MYIVIGIILVSFLGSCVPDALEVTGVPSAEKKLVVSTVIVPDRSIVLALSHSFGALDGGKESNPRDLMGQVLVGGANVSVEYGGKNVALSTSQNGFYLSTEVPQIDNMDYTLRVNDPATGRNVTATTKMKGLVQFDSLKVDLEVTSIDTFPRVYYRLNDPIGENWYMINIQKFDSESNIFTSFLEKQPYTYLFKDEKDKDGTTISNDFLAVYNEDYDPGDTLIVSLSNISEEYYNYLKTREDERLTINFLSEPFNLPSNVDGGYGFFNLHIPDPRTVVLGEPRKK